MKLILSPQRRDDTLTLVRQGNVLTLNGRALDLSRIPEGATLAAGAVDCQWIAGPISRIGGVLEIPIILPHGPIPYPPPPGSSAVTHPEPIIVTNDGPITLPQWAPPEPEPEPEPDLEDAE